MNPLPILYAIAWACLTAALVVAGCVVMHARVCKQFRVGGVESEHAPKCNAPEGYYRVAGLARCHGAEKHCMTEDGKAGPAYCLAEGPMRGVTAITAEGHQSRSSARPDSINYHETARRLKRRIGERMKGKL